MCVCWGGGGSAGPSILRVGGERWPGGGGGFISVLKVFFFYKGKVHITGGGLCVL